MFIDYVPLMLINMAAGLVVLACYVYWGLNSENQNRWPVAFGMTGVIALVTGLHMIFTWPLPAVYNITHGELSVFFGIIFLGAAIAIAKRWDLLIIAVYAFFAGLAAIVIGVRMIDLKLTLSPVLSGIGFILSGSAGVLAAPALVLRSNRTCRILSVIVLLSAAAIWGITGYIGYWEHLKGFGKWMPATMRMAQSPPSK
ncbi:MAG: DUF981 domain-containing protein [Phycisphaerae bacterium]